MKALCWHGTKDVRIDHVPEPKLINARDAILKVRLAAICGSDLHLYNNVIPSMEKGDILGHEIVGEIMELGSAVKNLKVGQRVVVPFAIACGRCYFCTHELYSLCDNSNPNAWMGEKMYGAASAGLFGYSHLTGGYAGGQAEMVRVPFADTGCLVLPDEISDEVALTLADILPTAFMAAENCSIQRDDVVAVFGAGPVGLLSMLCAHALGAGRVVAIDRIESRLTMAREKAGAEVINFDHEDPVARLLEMTAGRGPDSCIDAVGLEAGGHGLAASYDAVKTALRMTTDRPTALRTAIQACRKGGHVSVPGVFGGFVDKFPIGAAFNKGLTIKGGQTHVHRYLRPLLEQILAGKIDPSFVITHRCPLQDAPYLYQRFDKRGEDVVKIVLQP